MTGTDYGQWTEHQRYSPNIRIESEVSMAHPAHHGGYPQHYRPSEGTVPGIAGCLQGERHPAPRRREHAGQPLRGTVRENGQLPIGKDCNHLLVETSYFNPPMGLWNILLRIKAKGYFPILAHPERYVYMGKDGYLQLKTMDVKFQFNLFSLMGMYGKEVQQKTGRLQKMYKYAEINIHRLETLMNFIQSK